MDDRKTLISTGEHLAAIRTLGESYSDAEYLAAVTLAREVGAGERYADKVLGVDVEGLLRGVEQGDDDVARIEAGLRRRGINPAAATYEQYRVAALEASS